MAVRQIIKQQVKDGISPTSIVFSVGRIVSPDEADYLSAYKHGLTSQQEQHNQDLVEKVSEMEKNTEILTCYCDASGSDVDGYCNCEYSNEEGYNDCLRDVLRIIKEEK